MRNAYNDSSALRHEEICRLYGLDPTVHNIKEADDSPKARHFGWPAAERYPIDTPERTRLSWAYASEDAAGPMRDSILGAIKKAADFWGIELPVRKEEEKEKAYVIKISGEGWSDSYEVRNPTELKAIAEHVRKNASDFSYDTKLQFADSIVSAPRSLKERLDDEDVNWLRRVRGEFLTDGNCVKKACDARAHHIEDCKKPELGKIIRDLGVKAASIGEMTPALVRKAASAFDFVDRVCGLTPLYGSKMLNYPEMSIEGMTPEALKFATDNAVFTPTGRMTSRTRIAVRRNDINAFFSKVSGEDTSNLDINGIVTRMHRMTPVEADAFEALLGDKL